MVVEHDAQTQVVRLLSEYASAHDDGDVDGLVDRFAPNGEFSMVDQYGAEVRRHRGHVSLREMFLQSSGAPGRVPHRHIVSNVVVDVDEGRAYVRSALLLFAYEDDRPTPVLTGTYDDVVGRGVDGAWRFERRVLMCDGPPP